MTQSKKSTPRHTASMMLEGVPTPMRYRGLSSEQSCERTLRWLKRCKAEHDRLCAQPDCLNPGQMLFGINQGGTYEDLRVWSMEESAKVDCDGYGIGGLAVGEETEVMYRILDVTLPHAPEDKLRPHKDPPPVDVGGESDALLGDLPQSRQGKYLALSRTERTWSGFCIICGVNHKSARKADRKTRSYLMFKVGIRQDGAVPVHHLVEPAQGLHHVIPRPVRGEPRAL